MKMFETAAALMALPYLPSEMFWRDGQLVAVTWPVEAWELPDDEMVEFEHVAVALGLDYAFECREG